MSRPLLKAQRTKGLNLLPRDELRGMHVSACTFADLNADGHLELITSLGDGGGRGFYPTVVVVGKSAGGFIVSEAYNGGAMNVPSLDDLLVQIDGHRGLELLIPRRPGPYEGARNVPIVDDIYEFRDHRFHRADLKFPEYYTEHLLPKLSADIQEKQSRTYSGNSKIDDRLRAGSAAEQESVDLMAKMLATGGSGGMAHLPRLLSDVTDNTQQYPQ